MFVEISSAVAAIVRLGFTPMARGMIDRVGDIKAPVVVYLAGRVDDAERRLGVHGAAAQRMDGDVVLTDEPLRPCGVAAAHLLAICSIVDRHGRVVGLVSVRGRPPEVELAVPQEHPAVGCLAAEGE